MNPHFRSESEATAETGSARPSFRSPKEPKYPLIKGYTLSSKGLSIMI